MKVKYIGRSCISLTPGRTYNVLAVESGWYRVMDDTGDDYLFSPEEFEIIES